MAKRQGQREDRVYALCGVAVAALGTAPVTAGVGPGGCDR